MGQQVPIDSILVDRQLVPTDDLSSLMASIERSGQRVPILTNGDYHLIDGLRRLEALRRLGHTTAEVIATSMYPQACAALKRAREHGVAAVEVTPRRLWELYEALRPLLNITRSHLQRGRQRGQQIRIGGRALFIEALGMSSESLLQAVTQVYRAAQEDPTDRGDRAREAVKRLEAGETTVYMAVDYMRPMVETRDIVKLDEQRAAFETAAKTLNGLLFGLERIGPLNRRLVKDGEIEEYLRQLKIFRRKFAGFIHRIEEEINKQ